MLFPRIHSQPREILTFKGLIRLGDPIISGEEGGREIKQSNTIFKRKNSIIGFFHTSNETPQYQFTQSWFCMRSRKCAGEKNQISSMTSVFESIHTHTEGERA